MNKYLQSINEEVRDFFEVLSPEFPEWMLDYIYTPEMQRIDKIGVSCGTQYNKIYNVKLDYTNLMHSVGVALILWNFTKDKKQTLAGLFHDIATPVFKHTIDFMNGDYEKQESTEDRTEQIIKNSKEIMKLLERDNIKVEEVCNVHIYSLADNSSPRLCADRLEYNLADGVFQKVVFNGVKEVERYYNNLIIVKNEDGEDEFAFKDITICEEFIHTIVNLWPRWIEDSNRACMQLIADILKSLYIKKYIDIDYLYTHSEEEIIHLIQTCDDEYIRIAFEKYQNATIEDVYRGDEPGDDIYCISVKGKKRYINPLVMCDSKISRIKDVSSKANEDIERFLDMKLCDYIGFKFDFKPYSF